MLLKVPQNKTVGHVVRQLMDFKLGMGNPLNMEDEQILNEWLAISTNNTEIFDRFTKPNASQLQDVGGMINDEHRFNNYLFIREQYYPEADAEKKRLDNDIMWLMAECMMPGGKTTGQEGQQLATWALQSPDNKLIYDQFMLTIFILAFPTKNVVDTNTRWAHATWLKYTGDFIKLSRQKKAADISSASQLANWLKLPFSWLRK